MAGKIVISAWNTDGLCALLTILESAIRRNGSFYGMAWLARIILDT